MFDIQTSKPQSAGPKCDSGVLVFCNPVPNVIPEHYKIVNGETISDAEFEMTGLY